MMKGQGKTVNASRLVQVAKAEENRFHVQVKYLGFTLAAVTAMVILHWSTGPVDGSYALFKL